MAKKERKKEILIWWLWLGGFTELFTVLVLILCFELAVDEYKKWRVEVRSRGR